MANEIVQVAIDAYRGNVTKYSVGDSMQLLQKALVEANGGSTKLNYKAIRDGKCVGLFALVEEILMRTVVEGLQGDEYFNSLVDFRNVALGDKNLFQVEDGDLLFDVADAADGTQAIRRQRLGGVTETSINTQFKVVKIYEELNRVLSGQVDFNRFITKVSESFRQKLLNDIYGLWSNASATDFGGDAYFTAGAYDEDELLELIAHVEAAANGRKATIIGTKVGLRKLAPSIQGAESKADLYNLGYFGKFYGTDVVAVPQRHKVGSTDFVHDDKLLTIIAGDDKPIKCVYEGQSTIIPGELYKNQDLTQDYLYGERYGLGIILAGGNAGVGRYKMTA